MPCRVHRHIADRALGAMSQGSPLLPKRSVASAAADSLYAVDLTLKERFAGLSGLELQQKIFECYKDIVALSVELLTR